MVKNSKSTKNKSVVIKVYHGYGHTHNLVVYGHVFKKRANADQLYSKSMFKNIKYLLKIFMLKPYPDVEVTLSFQGQILKATTEKDGFFKFEWSALTEVDAGLHTVYLRMEDSFGELIAESTGSVYVPHITQYGVISDIDDTVMISHSAKFGKRMRELFIKNPRTRKTFPGVKLHYTSLAYAHTEIDQPNPFFYVSSSEWNLYDYLKETFRYNGLPEGAFLLNSIKRLKSFFKTGNTGHEGKLLRVMRILKAFPNQRFIFFGDNSQQDPMIYAAIAEKYSKNMAAVYIRNVRKSRVESSMLELEKIKVKNVPVFLFNNSYDAIEHSKSIGLIS